jgi:hypothetical protein
VVASEAAIEFVWRQAFRRATVAAMTDETDQDDEAEAARIWTPDVRRRYAEFMKHNWQHYTGQIEADQFGRCLTCLRLGFWKPDA